MHIFTVFLGCVIMGMGLQACAHFRDNPCDLNKDGTTGNEADVVVFRESMGATVGDPDYNKSADFNSDGAVTAMDFSIYLDRCF